MVLESMVLNVLPFACNPMLPSYRAALFKSRCSDWPHLSSHNPQAQSPVPQVTHSNPMETPHCYALNSSVCSLQHIRERKTMKYPLPLLCVDQPPVVLSSACSCCSLFHLPYLSLALAPQDIKMKSKYILLCAAFMTINRHD